nr:hypothetical protein [Bifidobacterium pseudolongum]
MNAVSHEAIIAAPPSMRAPTPTGTVACNAWYSALQASSKPRSHA